MRRALMVCIVLIFASSAWAEVRIIAHPAVSPNTMKKADAAMIFLGKKTAWDNGEKIVPVILRSGATHETFLKDVVEKTSAQFSTYWKQMAFWGKGREPKSFDTEADLVKYVSETKGAVGYADKTAINSSVRVLIIE